SVNLPNLYQTTLLDFEDEIVSVLLDSGNESVLREIVIQFDPLGEKKAIQINSLEKYAVKRYEVALNSYCEFNW
ncbi:MAG: hypothetical protein Q8O48_05415, partial [Anaerolineales bacterium]|nr:hypothetical protein [Anaerolineales bacterium]